MKKLLVYLGIVIGLFALIYILNLVSDNQVNKAYAEPAKTLYKTTPDRLKKETKELLKDENYQAIILPEELDKALENGESLFVYFFSPICPHCKRTTPVLNEIADEAGVTYRQMNVYEFEEQWSRHNIKGTPTLIYFRDGKEIDRISGGIATKSGAGVTREEFRQFFEKYK